MRFSADNITLVCLTIIPSVSAAEDPKHEKKERKKESYEIGKLWY